MNDAFVTSSVNPRPTEAQVAFNNIARRFVEQIFNVASDDTP